MKKTNDHEIHIQQMKFGIYRRPVSKPKVVFSDFKTKLLSVICVMHALNLCNNLNSSYL